MRFRGQVPTVLTYRFGARLPLATWPGVFLRAGILDLVNDDAAVGILEHLHRPRAAPATATQARRGRARAALRYSSRHPCTSPAPLCPRSPKIWDQPGRGLPHLVLLRDTRGVLYGSGRKPAVAVPAPRARGPERGGPAPARATREGASPCTPRQRREASGRSFFHRREDEARMRVPGVGSGPLNSPRHGPTVLPDPASLRTTAQPASWLRGCCRPSAGRHPATGPAAMGGRRKTRSPGEGPEGSHHHGRSAAWPDTLGHAVP